MLRERLNAALRDAGEAGDQRAAGTLRLILTAIKERDHCAREAGESEGVSDDEIRFMLTARSSAASPVPGSTSRSRRPTRSP